MALGDVGAAVDARHQRAGDDAAGVRAQAHRTALGQVALLVGHQVDHGMGTLGRELGGMRVGVVQHVARVLDHRDLHAQADAKVGDVVLARVLRRHHHARDAAVAKAAGHDDAVRILEQLVHVVAGQGLGVHPVDFHVRAVLEAAVAQRLGHGQVGVVQAHILAHQRDAHGFGAIVDAVEHLVPLGHVGRGRVDGKLAAHNVGEVVLLQHDGRLIEAGHGQVLDHAVGLDVAEQRNLIADVLIDGLVRAGDDDVGEYAHGAQLLDGVLGGLGLVLAGGLDVGHQRDVDEQAIAAPLLDGHLADGLQEGLALDVARRAADLGQHHVCAALFAHGVDEVLDLVGDVGNDLHGLAQVVAVALLGQHVPVDLAGGQVGVLVEVLVDEALVVAQVQVGFRAVVGDEHLAMLVGAHGAGVYVDVGVELLRDDLQAAHLEQAAQRCRRDALAKARNHAAGDENVLAHVKNAPLVTDFSLKKGGEIPLGYGS